MKLNSFLVTALVLGSSSAAMADSYVFSAGASFSWNFGGVSQVRDHRSVSPVRDHRTVTPVRDHRTSRPVRPVVMPGYTVADQVIVYDDRPAMPALVGPTWDCHNWDPTVDHTSPCTAFSTTRSANIADYRGWTALGVRESSIPSHQYITVGAGRTFDQIKIQANQGAPVLTRVTVRFIDGSQQVVSLDKTAGRRGTMTIHLPRGGREINQIIIYSAANSRGTYSVYGS